MMLSPSMIPIGSTLAPPSRRRVVVEVAGLRAALEADGGTFDHRRLVGWRFALGKVGATNSVGPRVGGLVMTRVVHVPHTVEQDEDGVCCAHAQLRPGVGANGDGPSREAAIADLREALTALIAEVGTRSRQGHVAQHPCRRRSHC